MPAQRWEASVFFSCMMLWNQGSPRGWTDGRVFGGVKFGQKGSPACQHIYAFAQSADPREQSLATTLAASMPDRLGCTTKKDA